MLRYASSRLIQFIPTLIGIYVLTFFIMRVLPSDPAQFLEGDRGDAQSLAATRARLGIDEPLVTQFGIFFIDALRVDFGRSFITRRPVTTMISETIRPTMTLGFCAMLIAVLLGVPLGIGAALVHNSIWDNISRIIALIGVSIPVFWLGLQLQILFGLQLKLLPISGPGYDEHLVLPSIAASLGMLAVLMRVTGQPARSPEPGLHPYSTRQGTALCPRDGPSRPDECPDADYHCLGYGVSRSAQWNSAGGSYF